MEPTIKPHRETTYHRDGTVSLWDVYEQQWRRLPAVDISDRTMATLSLAERRRIRAACRAAGVEPQSDDNGADGGD